MRAFTGFGPDVHRWFTGLEEDNSKAYFTAHRETYDTAVRGQLTALLEELAGRFGGEVKVFRQNRDVRFSADKSPYKTNTYGIVYGASIASAGLYASISADGLVAGSGYHMMASDQLGRFRAAIDEEHTGRELEERVAAARAVGLDIWGQTLATAPRGYPRDHPRIELLRHKSLTLGAVRDAEAGIGAGPALTFVADTWQAAAPITGWLDEHVGATTSPEGGRRRGR